MVQCEVVGCNTRSNKEFHFYMFPTTKKRRRTWLERLNRANFNPPLNKYVYVCARHFKPEDFEPDEKNLNAKGEVRNKPKLKMLAAPSLHLKPEPEPQPELDKKTRHQRAKRTEIFTPDTSASFKREPKVQVPKVGIKPYISLYQKYRRISLKRLKRDKDPPAIKWCYENYAVVNIKSFSHEGKCFFHVTHIGRNDNQLLSKIQVLPPKTTDEVYIPNVPEDANEVKQEVEDDPLAVTETINVKKEPTFDTSVVKSEPTLDAISVENESTIETSVVKSELTFEKSLVESDTNIVQSEPTVEVFVKVEPSAVETNEH